MSEPYDKYMYSVRVLENVDLRVIVVPLASILRLDRQLGKLALSYLRRPPPQRITSKFITHLHNPLNLGRSVCHWSLKSNKSKTTLLCGPLDMERPSMHPATVEFFGMLSLRFSVRIRQSLLRYTHKLSQRVGKRAVAACGPGKIADPSRLKSLLASISQYISKGVTLTRHSL